MTTSIVILNYNDWETTIKYINLIKNYNEYDYIVIVDNNSTDNSVEILKRETNSRIILIENKKNAGYAAGNNIGARYSVEQLQADIVFISNPDIECTNEDIRRIKNVLCEKDAAITTGLIYNFDSHGNPHVFSSFGWKIPTYRNMIENCFLFTYKIDRNIFKKSNYYPMEYVQSDRIIKVEAVPGCFFAITAKALKQIGYFDEDTFLYYEETILGYQIKKLKKEVLIVTDSLIYHCEDQNKNKTLKQRITIDKRTLTSAKVYLRKYLKKNSISVLVFSICFWIGICERRLYSSIREMR